MYRAVKTTFRTKGIILFCVMDYRMRSQRVDKVDTLLDGDAGSRRLVILALLPLSPPVPPLLLKTGGNTCVSAGFRL